MSTTAPTNTTREQDELRTKHALAQGKTFVWHQIFGAPEEASIEFYTKALGWGTEEFPMGEMGTYKMLTANGSAVAGVIGTQNGCEEAKDVPPHWSVSIGGENIDARIEDCIKLGAKVLNGPMDIPVVGRMALLQDPQGATFWLFQPAN